MNIMKIQSNVNKAYLSSINPAQSLKNFYKEGVKNPTLALILEKDEIRNITRDQFLKGDEGFRFHTICKDRYEKLKSNPEVQKEKSEFWHEFTDLYPRTAILRKLIIKFDRVNSQNVTPLADDDLRKAMLNSYKTSMVEIVQA